MDRVTIVCFLASYGVALALELWHQFRPRPVLRLLGLGFGAAGLLAQTIYLARRQPPLVEPFGWMLFLAWILAIFYLSGAVHHRRLAWGVFVLPLVLVLVGLGAALVLYSKELGEGGPKPAAPAGRIDSAPAAHPQTSPESRP